MSGYDLFIDRYARNRNLHYAEVKDTLAVLLFSTVEEWGDEIDPLRILANTLIEDPALHLSDSEVDSLSWALSGTDLLLDAEEEFGFTSPFPNLVEKVILDTRGYAFTRRVELAAVRQQIFDSTSRLDTDEIATKLRVLQRNVGESARDLPRLVQSSKQELRKAIEEKPRRELDE